MEDRELAHIQNNQLKLLELIKANVSLIAVIQQTGILDRGELDGLDAIPSEHRKTNKLLKILEGKTKGYSILLKAVTETKQSGAEAILRQLPQQQLQEQNINPVGDSVKLTNMPLHSKYRLNFENDLNMTQILQRLKFGLVQCLPNRNSNLNVIMQLETLLLFDSDNIDPITKGQYQTEQERMTALFDVIKGTGDPGILMCLEKLCDLDGLNVASLKIRSAIENTFPGSVQRRN